MTGAAAGDGKRPEEEPQLVLGQLGVGHSQMVGIIEQERAARAADLAAALAAHRLAELTIAFLERGGAELRPHEWGDDDPRQELYAVAKTVLNPTSHKEGT